MPAGFDLRMTVHIPGVRPPVIVLN